MLESFIYVYVCLCFVFQFFFFFKQKTAYEMRISDWSSDVCSSDLYRLRPDHALGTGAARRFPALRRPGGRTRRRAPPGAAAARCARGRDPGPRRLYRSEERRDGKECVSTCRSRLSQVHYKNTTSQNQ